MIRRLYVKNYVLIDSLDIEFPEGLVIITGQTGAGKSILIGSISLLLGAKADSSVIGGAGDNCIVEAEFDGGGLDSGLRSAEASETGVSGSGLRAAVEACGAEWDDGRLILRRVISRSGRSRAFVNDCPAPLSSLVAISAFLIDIHSQHQTLLLSDKAFRLSVLDHYAGNEALLSEMRSAFSSYVSQKAELEELDRKIQRIETERDYDAARFARLEAAALRDGELEELEAEQKRLANAEEIKENLYAVEGAFCPSLDDALSMDEALRDCEKRLVRVAPYVAGVEALVERVASARVELDDILNEVRSLNEGIDVSAKRLEEVDARLSMLYELLRSFSCRDVAGLIAVRDELGSILHDSTALVERRSELAAGVASSLAHAQALAARLHEARSSTAAHFATAIEDSLHYLELQYAVFTVELTETPLSATGTDAVLFKFSASGKNPIDVAKCASGGELSRIMLCLKDMMARYTKMPTMIFDEIDTGVSGSTADKMGSMICAMGENMQVFAITHLPQVAAKGQAHYLVTKEIAAPTSAGSSTSSGGSVPGADTTVTHIRQLDSEGRVMELARMLSGSTITPAAIANARELLK
ncbi:MAG: DNA repair protein RecN [Bacteroidales bacterium]|nr:DNA repair protein RecN [Bacteroidales bacterium]